MYLSSFRLGDHPERMLDLLGGATSAVVIGNALDAVPDDLREGGVVYELAALERLGLTAHELDLRDYTGRPEQLAADLARHRLVWVRGGNTFVLRHALARSGGDAVLPDLIRRDAVVYAGYSAGCCVLAPSLRGIELVDDTEDVRSCCGAEPIWSGLGVLDYAVVPHYRSEHPESEAVEKLAERYAAEGVPHRTLRDGEAIVVDA